MKKRAELHIHTNMSAMDGTDSITNYIHLASDYNLGAIAVTDHGSVQAFYEGYKAAKECGVKLIYGAEVYMTKSKEDKKRYHTTILVKNKDGLKNLYKIISNSYLEFFYKLPCIPQWFINEHRDNLLIGSACEDGELYKAVLNKKDDCELMDIAKFYDYLEVQPTDNAIHLVQNGILENKNDLININKKIIEIGDKLNKKVVATSDAHFIGETGEKARKILMCARGFEDYENQPPIYLKSAEAMFMEFDYLSKEKANEIVYDNSNYIAGLINDTFPPFITEKCYPKIKSAADILSNRAKEKLEELYGDDVPEIINRRYQNEISLIVKNSFESLYEIAERLTQKIKKEGEIIGTRGAVASSFIAFLLGITEINPLPAHYLCHHCSYTEFDNSRNCGIDLPDKFCPNCGKKLYKDGFNIPFETFAGIDGSKEPDMVFNISDDIKDKCLDYLRDITGAFNVFSAGIIEKVPNKTSKKIIRNYCDKENELLLDDEIDNLDKKICGVKKTMIKHPGGVFIVPKDKDIYDFTPIQYTTDINTSEMVTHFDFHELTNSLWKLDILTHDDLKILKQLHKLTGKNPLYIPTDDSLTFELIRSGNTLGIHEFENECTMDMLMKLHPECIDDLIRISALTHGTGTWTDNAENLIENKVATLKEVISTRDDINIYLQSKGFLPDEAFEISEQVRKGKGINADTADKMCNYGIPEWYINSCNMIKYLFPKAHCANYVLLAYRLAYYKANYPLEFYCAYFENATTIYQFDKIVFLGLDDILTYENDMIEKYNKYTNKQDCIAVLKFEELYKTVSVFKEFYKKGFKFDLSEINKSTLFIVVDCQTIKVL